MTKKKRNRLIDKISFQWKKKKMYLRSNDEVHNLHNLCKKALSVYKNEPTPESGLAYLVGKRCELELDNRGYTGIDPPKEKPTNERDYDMSDYISSPPDDTVIIPVITFHKK